MFLSIKTPQRELFSPLFGVYLYFLVSARIFTTMNTNFFKFLTLLVLALTFTSCDDATVGYEEIIKPNGEVATYKELSAGRSTIFLTSSKAYDSQADWVTGTLNTRFNLGDVLYDNPNVSTNGLGPVYAGFSCGSCHKDAGRTPSTLISNGGSGSYGFSSMLVYITRKNGAYFRNYGRVLHDQTIYGSQAEGKLHVTYTEQEYSFPDGEKYSLQTPHYTITDWYADSIAPEDLYISVRIPNRHVGMGQMMALDKNELLQVEKNSNYPEYGISGRLNYITERGVYQIGVSGNKAQHADLTVELGYSSDIGMTNTRYPYEVCAGQGQHPQIYSGIEVSTEDMENVDLYLHCLGVPARRYVNYKEVQQGEEAFHACHCDLCHLPTLHTQARGATLLNGTELPWLGGQIIHPYSDYLLHDMGPELDDHLKSGLAYGCEWRTTPLWGIGLQATVNGHTQFLHDGRARNLQEAILWHGGEGAVSKELFRRLSKEERQNLILFLETL